LANFNLETDFGKFNDTPTPRIHAVPGYVAARGAHDAAASSRPFSTACY
jgi:hypothetical protein